MLWPLRRVRGEIGRMGWIAAVAVLVLVAVAAGWCAASAAAARRKPRRRGPFLVGLLCGVTVGMALTARRRGITALGAAALNAVLRPPRVLTRIVSDTRVLTVAAALVRPWAAPSRPVGRALGVLPIVNRWNPKAP